jgi:DUF1009 family protein
LFQKVKSFRGAAASEIENAGAKVLDACCFMDEDLAVMTNTERDIGKEHLEKSPRHISELGIGQSAIVRKETVPAVEDLIVTINLIKQPL